MAVNLSARQFADDELLDTVNAALAESGLPPGSLELEITESIAMQGLERTVTMLTALKKLGIALAMDDFGTGYSSLSYLKRFPLDALKVDQSFVRNITTDSGDAAITRAVVAMAHSFDMIVIAEGVETLQHLEFLAGLGCEDAQGYLFSKPLPAADAGTYLSRMGA
jgi:EAL domain-containing protein (putative c-di-GMP-specific phosphodiesterase class I)